MEKVKKSFIRNFLPILIAAAVLWIISVVLSVLGGFGSLLKLIITPPLYVGLYSFLFRRMEDENPDISSVFSFYKNGGTWWKSFCMENLGNISLAFLLIVVAIGLLAMVENDIKSYMKEIIAAIIVLYVFLIFGAALFRLMPYLYARNINIGIGDAFLISIKYGLKYVLVFMAIDIVIAAANIGFITAAADLSFDDLNALLEQLKAYSNSINFFDVLFTVILSAVSMWADFTAVYIIMEREKIFDGNYNYISENDMEEEEPFIEPYDFFIEADERFNDEKVIETEDIRGVDILEILDEMELIDDIKVNFVIRRKLKKMFGELSFEIGEYNTYNGGRAFDETYTSPSLIGEYDTYNSGRSIENSFTEEIDDREFEVSVEITRNSDYEPFKLTLRVNVLEEE